MIDYNLPPNLEVNIDLLLEHLSPEDVKFFKEHCMMHFPSWLFKLIQRECTIEGKTFGDFVRMACVELAIKRIKERADE